MHTFQSGPVSIFPNVGIQRFAYGNCVYECSWKNIDGPIAVGDELGSPTYELKITITNVRGKSAIETQTHRVDGILTESKVADFIKKTYAYNYHPKAEGETEGKKVENASYSGEPDFTRLVGKHSFAYNERSYVCWWGPVGVAERKNQHGFITFSFQLTVVDGSPSNTEPPEVSTHRLKGPLDEKAVQDFVIKSVYNRKSLSSDDLYAIARGDIAALE